MGSTTGIDLTMGIQVASLALKHRRNKNGSQRIVVFVGSPLPKTVDSKALSKAGRMLKKNNVAIDIVVMGEVSDNQDRLKELVDAANGNTANADPERMCHLVTIPAGVLPSDVLLSSPIVSGGGMGMSGGSGVGASGGDMDVVVHQVDLLIMVVLILIWILNLPWHYVFLWRKSVHVRNALQLLVLPRKPNKILLPPLLHHLRMLLEME